MKHVLLFLCLISSGVASCQLTLKHNVGDEVIETLMYTCSYGGVRWARVFDLADFGISTQTPFIIEDGKIGISQVASWDVTLKFNIYAIDEDFPVSFPTAVLLGSSPIQEMPYSSIPYIFTMHFATPIVVPAGTQRILVEVEQETVSLASDSIVFPAGTADDDGQESWFRPDGPGCGAMTYKSTAELGYPNARFYIAAVTKNAQLGLSQTTSLNTQILPNPTTGNISINSESAISELIVFDLLGHAVTRKVPEPGQTVLNVDLGFLPAGIYIVQMTTSTGISTKRLLKV
jgi:hypothetical protein